MKSITKSLIEKSLLQTKKMIIKKSTSTALVFAFFAYGSNALTCDAYLKLPQKDARKAVLFAKDCAIQDKYIKLKTEFKNELNINIEDIAEYQVLRFIDRHSWEKAKVNLKAPKSIYNPAPATWEVWNEGIQKVFSQSSGIDIQKIDLKQIAYLNKILLTNGIDNIKDSKTDEDKQPGDYRNPEDGNVGFCSHEYPELKIYQNKAESSLQSLLLQQKIWEKQFGASFQSLVDKSKGPDSGIATLGTALRSIAPGCGPEGKGVWVSYVNSKQVNSNMNWIKIFLNANLNLIEKGRAILPPTELAAFIQKWLVTVHPFADGNGRTSRAVQDLILNHFNLPFAVGGDLQNDVLEEYNTYVDMNYTTSEKMLNKLEGCLQEYKTKSEVSFACKTYQVLNK